MQLVQVIDNRYKNLYNKSMIAIVDYDAGNIHSVINALKSFDVDYKLVKDPKELAKASGIVLPGVGSFGSAMDSLKKEGLDVGIKNAVTSGVPILGICLGLQLLFESSEESVGVEGLSLIKGNVTKLDAPNLKIPNIGWTSLENVKGRLLDGIADEEYFYFVHSYGCHAKDKSVVGATATYGETFDAVIETQNIFACQFHPEKSSDMGLKIIKNFLTICKQ